VDRVSNGTGSQLVFCNVPARDTSPLLKFYATMLGIDPGTFVHNKHSPVDQYETPVTASGIDLLITRRYDNREVTTTYWAVPDIKAAIQELTENQGGELVSGPTNMPDGSVTAALLDPEGNYVGLVQLADHAEEYFGVGTLAADDRRMRRRKQLRSALTAR
jgi:predicted enzyme related to lactoylglutathione lyase